MSAGHGRRHRGQRARDPAGKRQGHARRREDGLGQADAGSAAAGRRAHLRHGRQPPRSRRITRPGRACYRGALAAQRTETHQGRLADRRNRHHLRVTPQRHRRRGGPLFQVRQRNDSSRRQGGHSLEPNHCKDHGRGSGRGFACFPDGHHTGRADDRSRCHPRAAFAHALR